MEFKQLEMFVAVAEERSIIRAAAKGVPDAAGGEHGALEARAGDRLVSFPSLARAPLSSDHCRRSASRLREADARAARRSRGSRYEKDLLNARRFRRRQLTLDLPVAEDVRDARERIAPFIHRTPVIHSHTLSERIGANVHLKLEMFQKTGAFKVRGAFNRMLTERARSERAASSPSAPAITRRRLRTRRASWRCARSC